MCNHLIAGDFFELSNEILCIAGPDGFFKDVNQAFCSALGYTKQEMLSGHMISFLHPDDIQSTIELFDLSPTTCLINNHYRCADGTFKRLSWKYSANTEHGLILGSAREMIEKEQSGQIFSKPTSEVQGLNLKLEREVLELLSHPSFQIEGVVNFYLQGLLKIFPDMCCAVQIIKGDRLFLLSSLSLPKRYVAYFEDGVSIGPQSLCNIEATYLIDDSLDDVPVHPYFQSFREDLIKEQLSSCQSVPVFNEKKEVVGAFVAYYKKINKPAESEIQHIRRVSAFVQIIFEAFRTKENLKWDLERYKFVTLASKDAIYDWDITGDKIYWGEGFERFFGYHEATSDINWWRDRVHPEDIEEVNDSLNTIIQNPMATTWNSEYRFLRADNTYAYINEDGFVVRDLSGKAIRMVGAMHDHTKVYEQQYQVLKQNNRLREIAQINSHYIRKPLANILGLITAVKGVENMSELHDLISLLEASGSELDQIIRDIAKKTYF